MQRKSAKHQNAPVGQFPVPALVKKACVPPLGQSTEHDFPSAWMSIRILNAVDELHLESDGHNKAPANSLHSLLQEPSVQRTWSFIRRDLSCSARASKARAANRTVVWRSLRTTSQCYTSCFGRNHHMGNRNGSSDIAVHMTCSHVRGFACFSLANMCSSVEA